MSFQLSNHQKIFFLHTFFPFHQTELKERKVTKLSLGLKKGAIQGGQFQSKCKLVTVNIGWVSTKGEKIKEKRKETATFLWSFLATIKKNIYTSKIQCAIHPQKTENTLGILAAD